LEFASRNRPNETDQQKLESWNLSAEAQKEELTSRNLKVKIYRQKPKKKN
jgi:hypothetical protein